MPGLNPEQIIIAGESAVDFEQLLAEFIDLYQPATAPEHDLVEQMVLARWRLRRAAYMEKALFDVETAGANSAEAGGLAPDQAILLAFANLARSTALSRVDVYEKRLLRIYKLAEEQLAGLQRRRRAREVEVFASDEEIVESEEPAVMHATAAVPAFPFDTFHFPQAAHASGIAMPAGATGANLISAGGPRRKEPALPMAT